MVPGGWLGNLVSSYEWTGIGDALKILTDLFVDQVNFLGISTIGDSWVFRGSLAAPPVSFFSAVCMRIVPIITAQSRTQVPFGHLLSLRWM